MADNETIADIIAEMRGFKRYSASDSSDCRYVAYWLYQTFADRLEAAHKREIAAARREPRTWEECVTEYQKRKEAGEYGPY